MSGTEWIKIQSDEGLEDDPHDAVVTTEMMPASPSKGFETNPGSNSRISEPWNEMSFNLIDDVLREINDIRFKDDPHDAVVVTTRMPSAYPSKGFETDPESNSRFHALWNEESFNIPECCKFLDEHELNILDEREIHALEQLEINDYLEDNPYKADLFEDEPHDAVVFKDDPHDAMLPAYPSKWFETNPGSKPSITVSSNSADQLFHEINNMINSGEWSDLTVSSFLIRVIQEQKTIFSAKTLKPWISFGVHIANENEVVTPVSLLNLITVNVQTPVTVLTVSRVEDRLSLFYSFLLLYRKNISRRKNNNVMEVSRRLNTFFSNGRFRMTPSDADKLSGYIGLPEKLTADYKKVIAVIDMFFFKFPNHNYSQIRKATVHSRYKDCAALRSLQFISRITGMDIENLFIFVVTTPVAKDVVRISLASEDLEDIYGYFPYQLDLGVTTRTAYSVAMNPNLFLWLQTIGALSGASRSINAKMPKNATDLESTANSAAAVALKLPALDTCKRMFASHAATADAYRERAKNAMDLVSTTDSTAAFAPNLPAGAQYSRQFTRDMGASDAYRVRQEELERRQASALAEDETDDETSCIPLPPIVEAVAAPICHAANSVIKSLMENGGLSDQELSVVRMRLTSARTSPTDTIGYYLWNLFAPPSV